MYIHIKVKVLSHVQLFRIPWTLACQAPYGILQARILEWTASPFFRESSKPMDKTWVSCIIVRFFII